MKVNSGDPALRHGWGIATIHVELIKCRELPPLGTPQYTKGDLTAWIVE